MTIKTERLIITEFDTGMARDVYVNSLDAETARFIPDEVFADENDAEKAIEYLIDCYSSENKPLVYPVLLKSRENIGYVQAVPLGRGGWELGFHIAAGYRRRGYATEASRAFLPFIAEKLGIDEIYGICDTENTPSASVLEKCGFEEAIASPEDNGNKRIYIYKMKKDAAEKPAAGGQHGT